MVGAASIIKYHFSCKSDQIPPVLGGGWQLKTKTPYKDTHPIKTNSESVLTFKISVHEIINIK